jgi:hypothetical protein
MKAQSCSTLVVHEPLPNKTIWSFQGLKNFLKNMIFEILKNYQKKTKKINFFYLSKQTNYTLEFFINKPD